MTRAHVLICRGPDCMSRGAQQTYTAFSRAIEALGLPEDEVVQTQTGCIGPMCGAGPTVCVYPDGSWYGAVGPEDAARIVDEHLEGGRAVEGLVVRRVGGRP